MKSVIFSFIVSMLALTGCRENISNDVANTEIAILRSENDSLRKKIDSLTAVVTDAGIVSDIAPATHARPEPAVVTNPKSGKHPISLHWISWDKPGTATVSHLGGEWYKIVGRQQNDDGDYLVIGGKIRRLGEKELEFDGTIETRTRTNNGGDPCIKNGKQRFFGKGNRKYYRLQNMENCEGGMLVDYVDIFPGTSSL